MKKITPFLLIVFFFLQIENIQAQPAYDDCEGAFELTDVSNWCSDVAAFDNSDATDSDYSAPFCFPDENNDVWFRFTAIATDATVSYTHLTLPTILRV